VNPEMSDEFYFLSRCPDVIEFQGGRINPVPNLNALVEEIMKEVNEQDGFLYPPITRTWRVEHEFTAEGIMPSSRTPTPIRGSRREAPLFQLPVTHILTIDHPSTDIDFRRGDGAFILHLLGYLFGTRLQFKDWYIDMRIPIGKSTSDFFLLPDSASHLLSTAYMQWKSWQLKEQVRMTNLLYMSSRSPSYKWPWERFTIDYMVFDGLYKTAKDIYGVSANNHKERLDRMCAFFKVPKNTDQFDRIYNLRNELFHESLWAGGQPGRKTPEGDFYATLNLHYLNLRLIAAILGYRNQYIGTKWWDLLTYAF